MTPPRIPSSAGSSSSTNPAAADVQAGPGTATQQAAARDLDPTVPGGVYPENERPSFTTRSRGRWARFRQGLRDGLPFPLWCQGAIESFQAYFLGAVVVLIPALAAWFAGAWSDKTWQDAVSIGAQWWLSAHGVPLFRTADAQGGGGVLWFVPLLLTLVPFALAWRAGRRLARASWSDQLWQGIAGASLFYAGAGALTGWVGRTADAQSTWWMAATIPLVVVLLGLVVGARREAGSFGRLIGVDAADWLRRTSQYSRWAGSYLWAVARAGLIGWVASFGIAAVVLLVRGFSHWVEVVTAALHLAPGPVGGAVLGGGQGAYLPNLITWTLAWISGGGFSVGTESSFSPLETHAGPLPSFPVLALLPVDLTDAWWVMILPVVAGVVAGWWFMREGENHLEESLQLRFGPRWLALSVSTLLLGALVGLVSAVLAALASALASGSLGIGVFTDLGPHIWLTSLLLMLEIGVGTMIGYLLAPLFERDLVLDA